MYKVMHLRPECNMISDVRIRGINITGKNPGRTTEAHAGRGENRIAMTRDGSASRKLAVATTVSAAGATIASNGLLYIYTMYSTSMFFVSCVFLQLHQSTAVNRLPVVSSSALSHVALDRGEEAERGTTPTRPHAKV